MERVMVTRAMMGIAGMQCCAVADATDTEILAVCNRENPSGTRNGWSSVVRSVIVDNMFRGEQAQPVTCGDYPDRQHLIVLC